MLRLPWRQASAGALASAGEIAYDDATGTLRYRDGVNNQDRYLGQFGSQTVPACRLKRAAAQTLANGSAISWDTKVDDTNGMYSAGSPTRITVQTPGWYVFSAFVPITTAPSIEFNLQKNGAEKIGFSVNASGTGWQETNGVTSPPIRMAAGDYVEVLATAAATTQSANANFYPQFGAVWLGGPGNTVTDPTSPACRVAVSANQGPIADGGTLYPTFATETYDTDTMHDTVTNTDRITIRTPGVYEFVGVLALTTPVVSGRVQVGIELNGTTFIALASIAPGSYETSVVASYKMAAGDYVRMRAYNNAGAANPVTVAATNTSLAATYEGSGKTVIPRARIYRNAAFNTSNGWTRIPFDTVDSGQDNDLMFDSANGRLVCKTAGTYMLAAGIQLTNAAGGTQRIGLIAVNGKIRGEMEVPYGSIYPRMNPSCVWDLAVGDTVDAWVYQDTGGTVALVLTDYMTVSTDAVPMNWLAAVKVGQSGPGFNNDPGWAQSGNDLKNTNSGNVLVKGTPIATFMEDGTNGGAEQGLPNNGAFTQILKSDGTTAIKITIDNTTGGSAVKVKCSAHQNMRADSGNWTPLQLRMEAYDVTGGANTDVGQVGHAGMTYHDQAANQAGNNTTYTEATAEGSISVPATKKYEIRLQARSMNGTFGGLVERGTNDGYICGEYVI